MTRKVSTYDSYGSPITVSGVRSAAKGPAFTDRHIAPPAPSEPDQLELLAHTQEEK